MQEKDFVAMIQRMGMLAQSAAHLANELSDGYPDDEIVSFICTLLHCLGSDHGKDVMKMVEAIYNIFPELYLRMDEALEDFLDDLSDFED